MGTGNHGGFGNTKGSVRFRKGNPVEPTPKTYEMALSPVEYANVIAKKFRINLKGSGKAIIIKYDSSLPAGILGITKEVEPNVICFGPYATQSEKMLATTIAHELNHARSFLKGKRAPESTAKKSERALGSYIGGKR